jgi:hypothetical protein
VARRLDNILVDNHNAPSIREKYPWHRWCDGEWWLIIGDEDYTVSDTTFANTVYKMRPHIGKVQLRRLSLGLYLFKSLENEGEITHATSND